GGRRTRGGRDFEPSVDPSPLKTRRRPPQRGATSRRAQTTEQRCRRRVLIAQAKWSKRREFASRLRKGEGHHDLVVRLKRSHVRNQTEGGRRRRQASCRGRSALTDVRNSE